MSEPILIAQDLSKSFGHREAVKGISLQVARGEVFGLLGPDGSGKTTAISLLAGLLEPTRGKVTVDGLDVRAHAHRVKARLGLVPQELALYPSLSARQNLTFFGVIHGLKGRDLRGRVEEVLGMLGLAQRADNALQTCSAGMARRVSIGAGLLHKPELLLLDEPIVGVDPETREIICASVQALNRAGMTVLYATQCMEEAQRLCHRVAILDQGQVVALDTPTALIRSPVGSVLMLGGQGTPERQAGRISRLPADRSAIGTDGQVGGLGALLVWGMGVLGGSVVPPAIVEWILGPVPMVLPHGWGATGSLPPACGDLSLSDFQTSEVCRE